MISVADGSGDTSGARSAASPYAQHHHERWNRLRDPAAGALPGKGQADGVSHHA